LRALPICALLAGALGGCGPTTSSSSGSFHGTQGTVAKVISNLASAASNHDSTKICNQILASKVAARLAAAGGSCSTVVHKQLDDVDDFNITIESIAVSGNNAAARVQSTSNGHKHIDTLHLVHESGGWRVASLD
jgi:hypothetical protein